MKFPVGSRVIDGFGSGHRRFCTDNLDKATVVAYLRNYRVLHYDKGRGWRQRRYEVVRLRDLAPDTPEIWALVEETTAKLEALKVQKDETISAEAKKVWKDFEISLRELQKGA